MQILYIDPVADQSSLPSLADFLAKHKSQNTEIELVCLPDDRPFNSIEHYSHEALVIPDIVRIVRDAGEREFDATIVGCFYDPAVFEAREISKGMPVIGPCLASLQLAVHLANRIGIVIGRDKWLARVQNRVREYGYEHAVVSYQCADLGVDHLTRDVGAKAILESAKRSVEEDRAECIILGCTATMDQYRSIQNEIGVPVLDPVITALRNAESLAHLAKTHGWGTSNRVTMSPPPADGAPAIFQNAPPIGKKIQVK